MALAAIRPVKPENAEGGAGNAMGFVSEVYAKSAPDANRDIVPNVSYICNTPVAGKPVKIDGTAHA